MSSIRLVLCWLAVVLGTFAENEAEEYLESLAADKIGMPYFKELIKNNSNIYDADKFMAAHDDCFKNISDEQREFIDEYLREMGHLSTLGDWRISDVLKIYHRNLAKWNAFKDFEKKQLQKQCSIFIWIFQADLSAKHYDFLK